MAVAGMVTHAVSRGHPYWYGRYIIIVGSIMVQMGHFKDYGQHRQA